MTHNPSIVAHRRRRTPRRREGCAMVRPHKGRSLRVSGEVLVDAVPDTVSRLVRTRRSTPRAAPPPAPGPPPTHPPGPAPTAISLAGRKGVPDGARAAGGGRRPPHVGPAGRGPRQETINRWREQTWLQRGPDHVPPHEEK